MWKKYKVFIFKNSHDRYRWNVSEQSENEKEAEIYIFIYQKLVKYCIHIASYTTVVFCCWDFFFWLEFWNYFESCFLEVPSSRKSTKMIFLYCFRHKITLIWNHCPLRFTILVGLLPWSPGSHLPFVKAWCGKEEKSLHTEDVKLHMKSLKYSGALPTSI